MLGKKVHDTLQDDLLDKVGTFIIRFMQAKPHPFPRALDSQETFLKVRSTNTHLHFQTHICTFRHTFTLSNTYLHFLTNTHLHFQTHIYTLKHIFTFSNTYLHFLTNLTLTLTHEGARLETCTRFSQRNKVCSQNARQQTLEEFWLRKFQVQRESLQTLL